MGPPRDREACPLRFPDLSEDDEKFSEYFFSQKESEMITLEAFLGQASLGGVLNIARSPEIGFFKRFFAASGSKSWA